MCIRDSDGFADQDRHGGNFFAQKFNKLFSRTNLYFIDLGQAFHIDFESRKTFVNVLKSLGGTNSDQIVEFWLSMMDPEKVTDKGIKEFTEKTREYLKNTPQGEGREAKVLFELMVFSGQSNLGYRNEFLGVIKTLTYLQTSLDLSLIHI